MATRHNDIVMGFPYLLDSSVSPLFGPPAKNLVIVEERDTQRGKG